MKRANFLCGGVLILLSITTKRRLNCCFFFSPFHAVCRGYVHKVDKTKHQILGMVGPQRIIIVRHGERQDHMNPDFAKTYPRPHDSPLTDRGIDMARKLGGYLGYRYAIRPSDVVVLSSPLVRCVQTSNGIVEGLIRHSPPPEKTKAPIYVEQSIREGAVWLFHDMKKNPSVVTDHRIFVPEPLVYDAAHLKAHYSKYVEVSKPFSLAPDPEIIVRPHELQEPHFLQRCQAGAREVQTCPFLDGKTVILVGHGETVKVWHSAITGGPTVDFCPDYTAFVNLRRAASAQPSPIIWEADGPIFGREHLRKSSSQ